MKRLLAHISDRLNKIYDSRELDVVAAALCLEYLEIPQTTYYLKDKYELTSVRQQMLADALNRLANGEPLQYVVGSAPFCGLQFKVDRNVLIPRPETAELIEWVTESVKSECSILDIGTGSGCIAVTLSHRLPGAKIEACDVSEDALHIASVNAELNKTFVRFYRRDILKEWDSDKKYDVIVSNPPYIADHEKQSMEKTVLDYEPHLALFVDNPDSLLFYRAIAEFGNRNLNKGGLLFLEINPLYVNEMVEMLKSTGYSNIEIRKDIFGKDRMIKADIYG